MRLDYLCQREAYEAREGGNPKAVLFDRNPPSKTDPDLKAIPVVMLTSSREDSSREERDLRRSDDRNMSAYVVKPMRCHGFFEAIKEVGPFWDIVNQPPVKGAWRR
jgi:hypothetical protein